jgi:hypothetical protein
MQHDELIVFRHDEVLLYVVRALCISHRLGGERVLGQVTTGTAMCNDQFPRSYCLRFGFRIAGRGSTSNECQY